MSDPGYCHRCNIHEAEVCGYCEGTNPERPVAKPSGGEAAEARAAVAREWPEIAAGVGRLLGAEPSTGGACFICAREALAGLTFKNKPVCLHCAPHSLTGEVMLQFTDTENEAIEAGGAAAGAYLDSIGKTDLADLSPEQWTKFLGTFLHGYSDTMREAARTNPPF